MNGVCAPSTSTDHQSAHRAERRNPCTRLSAQTPVILTPIAVTGKNPDTLNLTSTARTFLPQRSPTRPNRVISTGAHSAQRRDPWISRLPKTCHLDRSAAEWRDLHLLQSPWTCDLDRSAAEWRDLHLLQSPRTCHLDRSAAEWRDLHLPLPYPCRRPFFFFVIPAGNLLQNTHRHSPQPRVPHPHLDLVR
jgi:hypothetical protein